MRSSQVTTGKMLCFLHALPSALVTVGSESVAIPSRYCQGLPREGWELASVAAASPDGSATPRGRMGPARLRICFAFPLHSMLLTGLSRTKLGRTEFESCTGFPEMPPSPLPPAGQTCSHFPGSDQHHRCQENEPSQRPHEPFLLRPCAVILGYVSRESVSQ